VTLAEALITNGLLQFGQFQVDGAIQPVSVKLDLLASYPDVLKLIRASLLSNPLQVSIDRILCPIDTLPIAVAVGLELEIPVVYSRRSSEAAVFDLVGAYDIGHPTLVIANYADSSLMSLIAQAERVGLRSAAVWTVIELVPWNAPGVNMHSLLSLNAILDDPFVHSEVAPGQIEAVRAWLSGK
jgi:hypothetical protein